MRNPNNPFDTSVPDPFDPEQMIEDTMHGPSAVHGLLEIPEMPLGDGTYIHPGESYVAGTHYFDANGQPLHRIGPMRSTSAHMREANDFDEWRETSQTGEEFLIALEGRRQQQRMERTGVAHAFKTTDVCGGGKRLRECEPAVAMMEEMKGIAANTETLDRSNEGRIWNAPLQLSRRCGACALSCQVAYETDGGTPTGITRFTTVRPLEGVDVIHIDMAALRPTKPTEEAAAYLRKIFGRIHEQRQSENQE